MGIQFSVKRDDFFKSISNQQNITNKKGTLAILANVLIETSENHIVITGTDLEVGLRQKIDAEISGHGIITLPAKKLFEITRESGSLHLSFKELEQNWVEITSGSSIYKLAGVSAEEFPQFPEYDEENMGEIEADIISDLIDKTFFSIALDKENMFTLTAAMLQKEEKENDLFLKMVTSDGHRLTVMSKKLADDFSGISLDEKKLISRRGVQEIRKFCESQGKILFGSEKKQVVLKNENNVLIIRLVDGDFPDFEGLIQSLSGDNIIKVDRIRFLEGLKRINLFTEDMFHSIKIEIEKNKITLNSQNSDYGSAKDDFEIDYHGEQLTLGFNCQYFIDTIQAMESDTITLSIKSQESPCMVTSEEDFGFLGVIMPMKLQ
ncbi:MAG: DNA polymerase III subunit beta [Desulfobulbus sp.]|jgi:DNA polymerase-3 subunit beta